MKLYGLIGYPLAHSFSKKYFEEKFVRENITDCRFENFPLQNISELPALINANPDLRGLSVTIPHKVSVINYLDEVDEVAKAVGAVNAIRIQRENETDNRQLTTDNRATQDEKRKAKNEKRTGFNTDVFGFEMSLKPFLESQHQKALILGTGGAAKAVAYVLKKLGIDFLSVSRNPKSEKEISYDQVNDAAIKTFPLIINTTPLGTFPDVKSFPPITYEAISGKHFLFDLVYNPDETVFLQKGKQCGAITQNGLQMLKMQAEKAWEIWNA